MPCGAARHAHPRPSAAARPRSSSPPPPPEAGGAGPNPPQPTRHLRTRPPLPHRAHYPGCGGSKEAGDYVSPSTPREGGSDAIERQLEAQQKEENKIVKLLVLGTGESGKSTVFKQMKILYSPRPPSKFIMVVRANLFGNAAQVRDGMGKLGIEFKDLAASAAAEKIKDNGQDGSIKSDGLEKDFATMYGDAGVQEAIERAHEFQLNDSTRYFWERAAEILKTDYLPSEQDVLRARVRTTGIVQQNFVIKDQKYTMFDVGGQRNERRKCDARRPPRPRAAAAARRSPPSPLAGGPRSPRLPPGAQTTGRRPPVVPPLPAPHPPRPPPSPPPPPRRVDPLLRQRDGGYLRHRDLRVRPDAVRGREHQPDGRGAHALRPDLQPPVV